MRINIRALLVLAGIVSIILLLINAFATAVHLPYSLFHFWHTTGSVGDWLSSAKWLLVYGAVSTAVLSYLGFLVRKELDKNPLGAMVNGMLDGVNRHSGKLYALRITGSVMTGFMQEVVYRWFVFFLAMFLVPFFNYILFEGWLGFGIFHVLQVYITGPVMNFLTFGTMQDQLNNPANWVVGFAVFASVLHFGEDHQYKRALGPINALILGLVMFYLLFTYGMWACITVHLAWDILLATIVFVASILERNARASTQNNA